MFVDLLFPVQWQAVVGQRTRLVNDPKPGMVWSEHRLQRSQISCGIAMNGD